MRVVCAFCFYHTDVEEDQETIRENSGAALMVYEDGSSEPM